MVLMGGKSSDGIKNVQMVNVGTEEAPQWALLITGDIDANIDMVTEGIATAANQRLVIVTKDITSADLTDNAYTFTEAVDAVAVKNDGTSDLTITISTLLFTIKPGESRIIEMASFTVTTFSASAVFRMNGLRRSG